MKEKTENPTSAHSLKPNHFSGMLNQFEFTERYLFISQRAASGYSREDIAFLLGKTSYHVIDFEELAEKVKMNYQDHEVMAELFRASKPASPAFNDKLNGQTIANEKRMIRGSYSEKDNEGLYKFIHPWLIKGLCTPITIKVSTERNNKHDDEIFIILSEQLRRLIATGFFDRKKSAMMIYYELYSDIQPDFRPLFVPLLRQAMFEFVRTEKIRMTNEESHIYYLTTK